MKLRGMWRWLGALLALGSVVWAVAQSQTTSLIGSYLELGAQVVGPVGTPTLNSTNDVSGNDLVRWTSFLQSRLDSPFEAQGELTLPRGQTWVRGSAKAASNVNLTWQVNGNWVDTEPANGAVVTAVRWAMSPLYTAKLEPVTGVVDFSGTGDGVRVIPFKDRLFVVNHYGSSAYFNCRLAKTGQPCPGFESSGMAFEPVAGTTLRPSGNSTYYTGANPLEAVNYKTGEMFVAVVASGRRQVLCTNLDTLKSCGSWDVGSESGSYPSAFETIGNEYYFGNSQGDLFCFDIARRQACGQWAIGASFGNNSVDSLALGTRLFVNNGSSMHCFDTSNHATCVGWPAMGIGHGSTYGAMPYLSNTGDPLGVCTSGARCYNLMGQTLNPSGAYSSFVSTYGDSIFWSHNTAAIAGTRFFEGRPYEIGCFDFKTDSQCGTVRSAEPYPYTTRMDPTRPNCVLTLGDLAQASLFDASNLGPCKSSLNGTLPDIDVVPSNFYACDPSRARVRAWGQVRMSPSLPWGGADGLSSVTVTLKDGKGQILPAQLNPVRSVPVGSYQLSIADIPYSQYPVLKVAMEFKTPGSLPSVTNFGIDVTWDGDPAQVCVTTKMPVGPDCQMTGQLTANTRALHNTTGVFQETLQVSKVLSPGGLSSGYAAFSSATTPRLNLSALSPTDPKTQVVQGRWALQYFTGDLWAFQVDSDGQIDGRSHASAQSSTGAADTRPMFTAANPNGAASVVKPLLWSNLIGPQQDALNRDLAGVADTQGPARLAYLRGTDGPFRGRGGSRLGPVINSAPVVLPVVPQAGLSEAAFPGYAAYRQRAPRAHPIALFGGNDGALHAYEVKPNGLSEAWSFVPDVMLRRAGQFADPDIMGIRANPYFVDNVPMLGHAQTGSRGWRAVAVMSYGRGARAITALDVTEPQLASGAGVFFEYNNTTDPELKDLGYVISQPGTSATASSPQFVQLGSGKRSAVLVGNGINSNDGNGGAAASGTGRPVLYAFYFDQAGGKRWHRWAVDELWAGAASEPGLSKNNGLSTPTPVDVNGDGVADLAYAGDLQGNLWRFDLRNPDAVGVTRLFKTDTNQPITQAPFVVMNPSASGCGDGRPGGTGRCWQVAFHTGAPISPLIGSPNTDTQSIYSVLDKGQGATVALGGLTTIPYDLNQIVQGVEYRALKPTALDYSKGALGWRIDLQAYEHGVGAPRVQPTGLVMFSSIRPTTPDKAINVCVGPRSWLNEVDPISGTTAITPFDTDGDGSIDAKDRLNPSSANPRVPSSMAVSGAQFGPPMVLLGSSANSQQMSLLLPSLGQDTGQANSWSGGSGGGSSSSPGANSTALKHSNKGQVGRMSWREIY